MKKQTKEKYITLYEDGSIFCDGDASVSLEEARREAIKELGDNGDPESTLTIYKLVPVLELKYGTIVETKLN